METLFQDLRYGLRVLLTRPGFTAVAIIALALGIGANSAIFSVVNGVVLRPLPYKDPDRLTMVWSLMPLLNSQTAGVGEFPVSAGDFVDWQNENQVFEQIAAFHSQALNATGAGEAQFRRAVRVTVMAIAGFAGAVALGL